MKKAIAIGLLIISAALTLCGCADAKQEYTRSAFAFDTYVSIKIFDTNGTYTESEICDSAVSMLNDLDAKLSFTKPDSEISRINSGAYKAPVKTDPQIYQLIKTCAELCDFTDGAFDITLGRVSRLWGFCIDEPEKPDLEAFKKYADLKNYRNIEFDDNNCSIRFLSDSFEIDMGAAAKGYALDMLHALLIRCGAVSAVVDFGGSIMCVGNETRKILVSTDETDNYAGALETADCYISTANGSMRYKEYDGVKYHHIMDTKTAFPAESDIKSCTVIASSGLLSDVFSTAFFVMGSDKALSFYAENPIIDAVITKTDGETIVTEGIKDIFTENAR